MKILICSDSHKRLDIFQRIIEKEEPEIVLFAGDHSTDALDLSYVYNKIKFYVVRGNTDYSDFETLDKIVLEMGKTKILLVFSILL